VIGCEYACTFAALGVRVTLVNTRARLLTHLDHEVSDTLRQAMTARLGITVHSDVDVRAVVVSDRRAQVTLTDGLAIGADVVLVCTGRVGNAGALGLDAIGVRSSARGFVQVDAQYRTAVPHIYAAGDAIGFPTLVSTSADQARVAIYHAFDLQPKGPTSEVAPYAVWTIPEIATVGETEASLVARGVPCESGRASFRLSTRGQIGGDTDGFLKLMFHPEDQRLLGVTIVGDGACELIHLGMTLIAFGGTIDYFIRAAFTFPSLTDTYRHAAYDGLRRLQRRHAQQSGLPAVPHTAM
jgi:NAD(P) transhydrogenase